MLNRPSSRTITESLELIKTLGIDKGKGILEKMRETQVENEKVIAEASKARKESIEAAIEAKKILSELNREKVLFETEKSKFTVSSNELQKSLSRREEELKGKERAFEEYKAEAEKNLSVEKTLISREKIELDSRIAIISSREIDCAKRENVLTEAFKGLEDIKTIINKLLK